MTDTHALTDLPARLLASPDYAVLVALLVAAAAIDWRTYRIPNRLCAAGAAFAIIYNTWAHGFMAGLLPALAGMAAALALLLPLYALRIMGAGDVKLMAMVGTFLGLPDLLYATVWTFIAGGIAAVSFALYHRTARRMTANVADIAQSMAFAALVGVRPTAELPRRASVGKLPYAASIAAGTIGWLLARLAQLA